MWGSYYFVKARAALAIIWYGVQRKLDLGAKIEAWQPLTVVSVFGSLVHVEYPSLHIWPRLYRYSESHPGLSGHHNPGDVGILIVLAGTFPILRFSTIPIAGVFLVQVHHCPSGRLGIIHLLYG
jgi:hypothetical protein